MNIDSEKAKIITHDFPVWREKSNFIIAAYLKESDIADLVTWEQIWAKQVENNIFEICCVPFFAYELALGDLVETKPLMERKYVINKIRERNGHTTYRVWFYRIEEWDTVVKQIRKLDCLVEIRWDKSKLIAIDAPTEEARRKLEPYLNKLESLGSIKCEITE